MRNNNTVNWIPESIGKGRFGDWLENVQDWGLSQKPLLGYSAEYLGVRVRPSCMRSEATQELHEMSDDCPEEIELHRPFIDKVTITLPEVRQSRCTVYRR